MKIILDTKEDFKDMKKIVQFLHSLTEENVMTNYPQQTPQKELATEPVVSDMFSMFGASEPMPQEKSKTTNDLLNDINEAKSMKDDEDDDFKGVQIIEY